MRILSFTRLGALPAFCASELATFLRIEHDPAAQAEAANIAEAAAAEIEAATGLVLTLAQVEAEGTPDDLRALYLPVGPVPDASRVQSVTDAASTTLGFAFESGRFARVVLAAPHEGPVRVVYEAGYGGLGAVPSDLSLAVLDHAARLYEMRGTTCHREAPGLSPHAARIIQRHKRLRVHA